VDLVTKPAWGYKHARMNAMQITTSGTDGLFEVPGAEETFSTPLFVGTSKDYNYSSFKRLVRMPNNRGTCTGNCHTKYYFFNYTSIGHPLLDTYHHFCRDTEEKWPQSNSVAAAKARGYRQESFIKIPAHYAPKSDWDGVALYRELATDKCVLVFEGTDSFRKGWVDWVSNLDTAPGRFCGFGGVHKGVAWELQNVLRRVEYQNEIKAKLPSCTGGLHVTGHSKGAGMATLFATCANLNYVPKSSKGLQDYALVAWDLAEVKVDADLGP